MKTSAFILLASLSATTVSSLSFADPPRATPAEAKIATERFKKGVEYSELARRTNDVKLYDAAYLEFAQSEAIVPTDGALWNMVQSALLAKRYVDAMNALTLFERRFHPIEIASHRHHKEAVAALAQATAATAHATIEADAGAYIKLDGESIGVAPLADTIHLAPGRHEFKAGSKAVEATINAGESYIAKLRTDAPPAPATASEPAPVLPSVAPAVARPSPPPPVHEEPASSGSSIDGRYWLGGGLAIAGAVGIGLGVVYGAKSNDAADQARAAKAGLPPNSCGASGCASLDDSLRSANSSRTASIVMVGVGSAALVGAGAVFTWIFLESKEKKTPSTTMGSPVIAPGFYGAQWTTTF